MIFVIKLSNFAFSPNLGVPSTITSDCKLMFKIDLTLSIKLSLHLSLCLRIYYLSSLAVAWEVF
ncbi:hypothetical protein Ornrh_2354 [Ornithobacterium rhinotracheale DSM 15997]|uniref:Uncharacterized protein n=1 Tax=Ornithobacterium rhinotracheale (strain ATCC 51463 / DSM 15997 / CCUG 23171 / CIP 104009 / LMG 9086) TaxID=867902 RepID=I4A3E9_ORNRL|nr:hypothetical protein Ornrh_2354 [Ornithobacterium rhinotracheale DSM 15997]